MSDDIEHLKALESLFRPAANPPPYMAGAGGVLTPGIIARALDEMWTPRLPAPPGGYRATREPFGALPVTVKPPEWAVEAGGYRLVIRDGAMIGLEYDEPWPGPADRGNCRVYWGSHGCDFKRGHEGSCACDCCECPDHPHHPEEDEWTCVAKPPYYGPETRFYGEDAEARGLPTYDE